MPLKKAENLAVVVDVFDSPVASASSKSVFRPRRSSFPLMFKNERIISLIVEASRLSSRNTNTIPMAISIVEEPNIVMFSVSKVRCTSRKVAEMEHHYIPV